MYESKLGIIETEIAIKKLKNYFEESLANELNLIRVTAPLFVKPETGLNDNLNGVERAVNFDVKFGDKVEIVHSLAKWKRMALEKYGFKVGTGIYTDMNAIRRDEDLSPIHSFYVDQWDWEKVINKEDRTEAKLKDIVRRIFKSFKSSEEYITGLYPTLTKKLPEDIFFITTQELEDKYPTLTSKEREHAIAKEYKAVFLMQVGHKLNSGEKHDGRAPDYDDWNLNGDIIFWYEPLQIGLELSSMGIRVCENSLQEQLSISGFEDRKELDYHKALLEGKLPYTIGGGIGQSRICLFFLDKMHIGEVQASVWDPKTLEDCKKKNIKLL